MDRRLTPATDRVALDTLRGRLDRPAYTAGRPQRLAAPLADLLATPGGRRDRQLLYGADLILIDEEGDWAFVQAEADDYCGWVSRRALGPADVVITHRVSAPATHLYPGPDIKLPEACSLSLGARLAVVDVQGRFARLACGAHVPAAHIDSQPAADPVEVAGSLTGTPYLWGGNSRAGIDCSGLVQVALTACGIRCPGDSDLQRLAFGRTDAMKRGDLLFWPGHVAMATCATQMIHATAACMAVITEPIADAMARIDAAGDGPFLGAHRPGAPT